MSFRISNWRQILAVNHLRVKQNILLDCLDTFMACENLVYKLEYKSVQKYFGFEGLHAAARSGSNRICK